MAPVRDIVCLVGFCISFDSRLKAFNIICDLMGLQALSWQLPTSYSFGPRGNIAPSSNRQSHNNRFLWITN